MGFSQQFWILLLLSLLEFIFLLGPVIYYKITKKENMYSSIVVRALPPKHSLRARIVDIIVGVSAGVFLSFFAQGLLYGTVRGIIAIFGVEFYDLANSGSIDLIPPSLSTGEIIVFSLINFFVIGLCEEYFFRSVLFIEFKKKLKNWSYLLNGTIFALYHVFPGIVPIQTTITYFLYYFLLAIFLCVLLETNNNDLLSNIIAHGTFNTIPLILSLF